MAEYTQGGLPTEQPDTEEQVVPPSGGGGALYKIGAGGKMVPAGNITIGPEQSSELLQNMQRIIDEREGPLAQFTRGLERASAWGSGGVQGPAQSLALINQQQAKETQDLFNMRQQMAAIRSAAAQQEATKASLGNLLAGGQGAGAGGRSIVDPEVMGEVRRLYNTGRFQDAEKYYQDNLKKAAEVYAQPGMDEPKIAEPIYDPQSKEWVTKLISVREKRLNQEMYGNPPAAATKRAPSDVLSGLINGVHGQESNYGKVDTSAPNYAGAIGPMQIMPKTFEGLKKERLIPEDFDIKNPIHNKQAGEVLLSKYFKQYKGDVDKTLAAYYGGEGAVNADGSINYEWRDKLNPKAPNIKEYINQVKERSGLTVAPASVAVPPSGIPPKPVSPQQLQKQEEVRLAYQKEQAQTQAQAARKEIEGFKAGTETGSVTNQLYLANRLGQILEKNKDNPNIVGLLNEPNMTNAISTVISKGIQTPVGSIGVPGIQDALQKVRKGVSKLDVETRQEIESILDAYSLEISKTAQGQGAMSDFERQMFQKIAGSTSQGMDMLRRIQRVMDARANFNDRVGRGFEDTYKEGTPQDFEKFKKSDFYRQAVAEHRQRLMDITKDLTADPSRASGASQPAAPSSGKTSGNVSWKVVQ